MSQNASGFNGKARQYLTPDAATRIGKVPGQELTVPFPPFDIPDDRPVLIAGPTASAKSALSLRIAARQGRAIINADALQVFGCWRILTARPSASEEAQASHFLYGHVPCRSVYSVGAWLRDIDPLLSRFEMPPIIVGGTGLYFRALTEGMAEIPLPDREVRDEADALMAGEGIGAMLRDLDRATLSRIDTRNPARVRRAWEVLRATGRGLAAWQDDTPPPRLSVSGCFPIVMSVERDRLNARIDRRFDAMIARGVLDEARAMLDDWDPGRPSSRAIGAAELVAHLRGELTLEDAISRAKTASHQYAKRQRTWFRTRMRKWHACPLP